VPFVVNDFPTPAKIADDIIWYFARFVRWRVMDTNAFGLRGHYHWVFNILFYQHLREDIAIHIAPGCDEGDTFSDH